MLTEISGEFVRIAYADEIALTLDRKNPARPAARFNRTGQDALYLSPDEASARVAIGEYVKASDRPRVLLRIEVSPCRLFDLRAHKAAAFYALAAQPWQPAMARGDEPRSWQVADELRQAGHAGLIDPSRQSPGLWHITLFQWNEPTAPTLRLIGDPEALDIQPR
ncbi:RES family NAD+ phosphorylase [Sneathiella marina]|uniref:RES family NAD+ phosphorylase n=1 Tax=Sneathiella marina TaxID=2950108 RepID=A0ABY4W0A2_9PROT|nr:RES family NAD+ phosphorylase [Sneathiella marina]USG60583.1 RES family NAD+ phosphorylase [Sneathiella marina]